MSERANKAGFLGETLMAPVFERGLLSHRLSLGLKREK
jgi:hypothetical protein